MFSLLSLLCWVGHLRLRHLVSKFRFESCNINFLMVGHTHEDIDQLFGVVCSLIQRKGHWQARHDQISVIQTPDADNTERHGTTLGRITAQKPDACKAPSEILTYLVESLRPRFRLRGSELCGEFVRGVRNYQSWMAPLGMHLHNAFANRRGIEAPHAFAFRARSFLTDREAEDLPGGCPDDIVCCVKTYMRDVQLQHPPVVVLPLARQANLMAPTKFVLVHPLTAKEIETYLDLEHKCRTELDLPRAAAALHDLVHKRDYEAPVLEWLVAPVARRPRLLVDGGNPYFPHLPATSFQLVASARRLPQAQ